MTEFIEMFADRVVKSGLSSRWSMKGCSDAEIRRLEDIFEVRLPEEFKAFLRIMGHGAGKFMRGTDIFYRHLFDNRAAAEEMLEEEDNPFYLSPSTFVFSNHQGYIFHAFDCDTHLKDPPVFGFADEEPMMKQIANSFSDFLLMSLVDETNSWRNVPKA